MTLLYVLVLWSWGKRTPTSFWETRLRESKPMSKIVWVQKPRETRHTVKRLFSTCWCREAEGNIPQQVFEKPGWGKVNPCQNLFGSRRPSERRHILGWALKAEWNDSSLHVGAVKLREMNPTSFWEPRLSESKPRSKGDPLIFGGTRPRCCFGAGRVIQNCTTNIDSGEGEGLSILCPIHKFIRQNVLSCNFENPKPLQESALQRHNKVKVRPPSIHQFYFWGVLACHSKRSFAKFIVCTYIQDIVVGVLKIW